MVASQRVMRARNLLVALVERMRAGVWLRGAARSAGDVAAVAAVEVSRDRAVSASQVAARRLPRRFGWLVWLVPFEAGSLAGQLRTILAEPGMMVLLADAPQAMQMLRPLCWMLGVRLDVTRRDPQLAPVAVPAVGGAQHEGWVPPVEWGWDLTLPAVGWWVPLEGGFKTG